MTLVDLIAQNKLTEAKEIIFNRLDEIAAEHLEEEKAYVASTTYTEIEVDEQLDEANVVRVGRMEKIRRRIRRNKKGQIVVQKNKRKSAVKGFKISGNSVVRIPAIQRIQKSRKLKRYWKTKGKAKLRRTLLKRKMSLRRRTSMGIK
tara:strand:+ start:2274 stop:2714 length:441 start_codon:yes stop_codon:yes gene_type:complete